MNTETLPHGTVLTLADGQPIEMIDRHGNRLFEAQWTSDWLVRARFRLPSGHSIEVAADGHEHPIFGPSHAVRVDNREVARFEQVDWSAPRKIPPMDNPTAPPPGGGAAILNFLALQARRAGVSALRYTGPYATGQLFDALHASFRIDGDVREAFAAFTDGVEQTASTARYREAPVDWVPEPFEWVWVADDAVVQLREGLDRVYLEGKSYDMLPVGSRRLRRDGQHVHAQVVLAGEPWADRGVFTVDGQLVEGPHPLPTIPPHTHDLPDAFRTALLVGLPNRAPEALRPALELVLREAPMRWGDAGTDPCTITDGQIVLHAVLAERLNGTDPLRALDILARAVEPIAQRLATALLSRMVE